MNLYTSFDSQIVSFEPAINWSSYTFSYTALVNFVYEFQPLLQASLLSFLSFGSSLKSCDNRASDFTLPDVHQTVDVLDCLIVGFGIEMGVDLVGNRRRTMPHQP